MKLKALFVAVPLLALATAAAFAQVAAPIVVAATPATAEAVANTAWWAGLADQVIAAFVTVATAAVAALSVPAFTWLRNRSKLAAMFVTQGMVDRMVTGVQNLIRASATDLEHKIGTDQLTPDLKKQIAAKAQPKVEAAFRETLQRIGKVPGSQGVNDMILGHVEQALAKPAPIIPAVMTRS